MADAFATEVRERYAAAEEADSKNCEQANIDLKFEAGEQWDPAIRQYRESNRPFPLPCLTVNTTQQFTAQVVGDWRANETSIKVLPREDGDKTVAEIRSELIRSIELQSKADRVYASSLAYAASCGISNFRVDIDYAYEDAFERDIFIRDIPHPLAVKWDPLANDPTANDAGWCFVADTMTADEYERAYPDAAKPAMIAKDAGAFWGDDDTVHPQEYWKIVEKLRTFAMMKDGSVHDVTDLPEKKWRGDVFVDPQTGEPVIREKAKCKYAVKQMTNGLEALTDPYELKLPRLPIIRVMGREIWTEDGRVRFGLVRFLRDSQRYKNYNRSIRAELLMRAPRVNFFAPASAVEGREGDFENALIYNDGAQAPTEVTNNNLGALLREEEMCAQDMMDVTGIHEASRGMPSNEQSGRAILARQKEGDIAAIVYHDNMLAAQREAGEVINALIPQVYDTARTIRTVGPDLGVKLIRINDPMMLANGNPDPAQFTQGENDPRYQAAVKQYKGVSAAVPDLAVGKYDVTVTTGPTFATRRQEGVAQLMDLAKQAPMIAQAAPDIIVGEMDLVNGDALKERLKNTVPPQVLGDDANEDLSPEQQQQKEQQAQKAQLAEQIQARGAVADVELKEANAAKAKADAIKAVSEAQSEGQGEAQPNPLMVLQDLRLKTAQADQAEANAAKAQAEAMKAVAELGGTSDPEGMQRNEIEAYNAITKRIIALKPYTPPAPDDNEDIAA